MTDQEVIEVLKDLAIEREDYYSTTFSALKKNHDIISALTRAIEVMEEKK